MAGIPLHPKRPERICWGCERYCPAHDLACGNGTLRTPHPQELYGDDWVEWAQENGIEIGGADASEHVSDEAQSAPPTQESAREPEGFVPLDRAQLCRGR